jgi:hypothetical protein
MKFFIFGISGFLLLLTQNSSACTNFAGNYIASAGHISINQVGCEKLLMNFIDEKAKQTWFFDGKLKTGYGDLPSVLVAFYWSDKTQNVFKASWVEENSTYPGYYYVDQTFQQLPNGDILLTAKGKLGVDGIYDDPTTELYTKQPQGVL